ncbi:hypothetical protein JCM8547_004254 [Rhodosporidiobolus lusitaniae]
MPPVLPVELQLYILELALPSPTLANRTERRRMLKVFSLVHPDWTATAQRLLFSHLHLALTPREPVLDHSRIGETLELARRKTRSVEVVELDLASESRFEWCGAVEKLFVQCSEVRGAVIEWSDRFYRTNSDPFHVSPFLSNLRSLSLVQTGGTSGHPQSLNFSTILPDPLSSRLTRLVLFSHTGFRLYLPTFPSLLVLLIDGASEFQPNFRFDRAFPCLHVFGWRGFSSQQYPPFLFDSLPSTIKHVLLEPLPAYPPLTGLSAVFLFPQCRLQTRGLLYVHSQRPPQPSLYTSIKRLLADWRSCRKRLEDWEKKKLVDHEEWEAALETE